MQQDIIRILTDESFQRWLAGKATSEEKASWDTWLSADTRHLHLYTAARKLWCAAQFIELPKPDADIELKKLESVLGLGKAAKSVTRVSKRNTFLANISTNFAILKNYIRPRYPIFAVTAFVILIAIYVTHNISDNYIHVRTDFGQRKTINLADGSQIIINANSHLSYSGEPPATEFTLTGEAFFHVAPRDNSRQPFRVKTKDGTVHVFGTRFNVHERDHGTRVVVNEGCVGILPAGEENNKPVAIELNQGDMVHFYKNDRILIPQSVVSEVYTCWFTDRLIFNKTPVREIIARIEETYDVAVVILNAELLEQKISGSIENTDLHVIIQALSNVLQVPVVFTENKIILGQ
ncbi:MAG: DUF4974 domain-containing protein [Calditrichaeota bacterium]|nr:MAG: DUF4974 domain-containing protein [Calditrichota bacterium]